MTNTAEKLNNVINGVNTDRIIQLATSMSCDDNYGKFCFRADNTWIDGSRSRTSIKNFYAGNEERAERTQVLTLDSDQPAFLAGENTAPNAVEHYLNALVGCLSTTVIAHASVQGLTFETLDISAEGEMDARGFFGVSDSAKRGYKKITVNINGKSQADEDTVRKLISYSPVYEMVSKAVPVEVNIILEA